MSRVKNVVELLETKGVDALYLTKKTNVNYISGFPDEEAYAVICKDGNFLVTDSRYMELAEKVCKDFEIINWHNFDRSVAKAVKSVCDKVGIKKLGFERTNIVFDKYEELKNLIEKDNGELIPTENIVETLRYVKDKDEIKNTRKACEIADKALEELIPHIKAGVSEIELATKLEYFMKMNGAQNIGFETILISGAKTSLLHGKPSDKIIEKGDFVLIDYGAMYNGYISDTTRTFIVGGASEKQLEIYNLVKEAQNVGVENMKAGVHATIPDAEIRKVVKKYEDYYYQGIGHGVGRDVHEEPFIGNYGDKIIEEGCIITMEPGIYFPEWGGVRIEDTVLITKNGPERLTKFPKDLMILDK
ncbi:TPA: M24 family metallopeptidase [Clostridioides difficile]|nr:aminopeptidase P family protein [Clostridioides difficile]